jgi:Cu-Zn family superoxide dismutase
MKTTYIASAMIAMALFASCKGDTKTTEKEAEEVVKEVKKEVKEIKVERLKIGLESKSDTKTTGSIIFEESEGTVKLIADIQGLSEGTHAIHIHEKADCSSPDGKSSGGHWNPTA